MRKSVGRACGPRAGVGSTQFTLVPTPAVLSGNLSGLKTAIDPSTGQPFPNNQIPADRISQFAKAMAAYYPAPNNSNFANLNYVAILVESMVELFFVDHEIKSFVVLSVFQKH